MGIHTPPLVRKIFRNDNIRTAIFSHLSPSDIASLRGTSCRIRKTVTPAVFQNLTVTFSALSFNSHRLLALTRIGHHVKAFRFVFPHTEETYMPPMLDPDSRRLLSLLYEPFSRQEDKRARRSTFGSKRIDSLALHNYGILLMAALDAPQFTRALACMENLESLIVSCPGTPMGEPGRRCVVDFALWSLRIAVERARLHNLRAVILDPVHLTGLQYLLPGTLAVGNVINSRQVWSRVTTLTMTISAWKELANGPPTLYKTNLKFLHQFFECFKNIKQLEFCWTREARSICPLTLDLLPYRSPMLATKPARDRSIVSRRLTFPSLGTLRLENIGMNACDLRTFLSRHLTHFREWSLDDVSFITGTLEEALQPLYVASAYGEKLDQFSFPRPLTEDSEVSFLESFKQLHCPYCSTEFEAYLMV